ncbi:FG-GAP-like repeat-containing protein [Desulforegula conservatrix]|uniref:FG-GAP-like repeat-containing protein n=1 Tax=Desulforegula conservatrix TaxID=153026 RepID=UPI0004201E63|nr:FG-GAP-like repeat-containing protein [Desulforegula conservatrix]
MNKNRFLLILFLLVIDFRIAVAFASGNIDDSSKSDSEYLSNNIDNTEAVGIDLSDKNNDQESNNSVNKDSNSEKDDGRSGEPPVTGQAAGFPLITSKIDFGSFNISANSSSGSFNSGIQIAIPSGRQGLTPDLTLHYQNSKKNGWLGIGWDLSFGVIQRSTKDGLDYESNKFEIKNMGGDDDLVDKAAIWGEGYFGKKIESEFSKFYYSTQHSSSANGGWIVYARDGKKMYFGSTPSSRYENSKGVFAWYLDKIEDANGNNIIFSYNKDNGTLYPSEIKYTGHANGSTPGYKIDFVLEDRPDAFLSCIDQATIASTAKRLSSIQIYTLAEGHEKQIRNFILNYSEDDSFSAPPTDEENWTRNSNRSQLISVTQEDPQSNKRLPSVKIGWGVYNPIDPVLNALEGQAYPLCMADMGYKQEFDCESPQHTEECWDRIYWADINGDGKQELVYYNQVNNNGLLSIYGIDKSGGRQELVKDYFLAPFEKAPDFKYKLESQEPIMKEGRSVLSFMDLNGDSRADVVYKPTAGQNIYYRLSESKDGEIAFGDEHLLSFDSQSVPPKGLPAIYDVLPTDINGDGRSDLIICAKNKTRYLAISRPDETFQYQGQMEIGVFQNGFYALVDFNGDGIADIFKIHRDKYIVYLGKGDGTFFDEEIPTYVPNSTNFAQTGGRQKVLLNDINKDGLIDLVFYYYKNPKNMLYCYYGNGDGTFGRTPSNQRVHIPDSYVRVLPDGAEMHNKALTHLADIDKDGNTDVIFQGARYIWGKPSDGELVKSISNGKGSEVSIEYKPSSDFDEEIPLPFVTPVVSKILLKSRKNMENNESEFNYSYSNGYFDKKEREFRGFKYMTVDRPDGSTVITTYHQDAFRKGRASKVEGFRHSEPMAKAGGESSGDLLFRFNYNWAPLPDIYGSEDPPEPGDEDEPPIINRLWAHVYLISETSELIYGDCGSECAVNKRINYTYNHENGFVKSEAIIGRLGDPWAADESIVNTYDYTQISNHEWMWRISKKTLDTSDANNDDVGMLAKASARLPDSLSSFIQKSVKSLRAYAFPTTIVRQTEFTDFDVSGNPKTEKRYLEGKPSLIITYDYDDYGNTTKVIDAKGYATETVYDSQTNTYPAKIVYPATTESVSSRITEHIVEYPKYDYNAGKPIEEKGRNYSRNSKDTTTYEYDGFGRLIKTNKPEGGWIQNTYFDFDDGRPNYTVTNTWGGSKSGDIIESITYIDGLGRKIQETTRGAQSVFLATRTYYDNMGRVSRVVGPFETNSYLFVESPDEGNSKVAETEYDEHNNPTLVRSYDTNHGALTTQYEYAGSSTTIKDPDGSTKEIIKDCIGRISQVYDGIWVSYTYNAANDLVIVTKENSNLEFPEIVTKMHYDTLGRMFKKEDPDLGVWNYYYDNNGNLTNYTDGNGNSIIQLFDEQNRIVQRKYKSKTPPVLWKYDQPECSNSIGKLTYVEKGDIKDSFSYDIEGRQIRKTRNILNSINYITETKYDVAGRIEEINYPGTGGYKASYNYHPGTSLVSSVTTQDASASIGAYTPSGQIKQIVYGDGVTTNYSYDSKSSRLGTIKTTLPGSGDAVQDLAYTYTKAGDVKTITDNASGSLRTYEYGERHQLKSEITDCYTSEPNTDVYYDYDYADYDYHPDPIKPHAVKYLNVYTDDDYDRVEYRYDSNGNMTDHASVNASGDVTQRKISFNSDNMPVNISSGGSAAVEIVYDGDNKRAVKTSGYGTSYYAGDIFEERTGKQVRYIFAGNQRIASSSPGEAPVYFHKDHLGSTTVLTRNGTLYSPAGGYYPYGLERSPVGDAEVHYTFTDQERDTETGLMNYDARLYDPALAQFLSPDTVTPDWYDPISLNRYAYCRNNPLKYTDPDGHIWQFAVLALISYVGSDLTNPSNVNAPEASNTVLVDSKTNANVAGEYATITGGLLFGSLAVQAIKDVDNAGKKLEETVPELADDASEIPNQLHHFATNKNKTYTPRMKKIADQYGLDLGDSWNKEIMPHQGRHPNVYHDFVERGMERAAREAGKDTGEFLNLFEKYIKEPVRQNPSLLRKFGWE